VAFYVLTYINGIQSKNGTDYCKIEGSGGTTGTHTICKFNTPATGSACIEVKRSGKFTTEERKEILKIHNELRAKVANGLETRGPQPNAADMLEMVWDFELETIAQRWINQCTMKHDDNRNSARFHVGQNLAMKGASAFEEKVDWKSMIGEGEQVDEGWYSEVVYVTPNLNMVQQFSKYDGPKQIGHYTQLVWGDSRYVGCGFVEHVLYFKGQKGWSRMLGCNYGPAGNVISRPMYTIGDAASKCPKDYPTNSATYPGLCSNGKESEQKLDVNPIENNPEFRPPGKPGSATALFDSKQLTYLILLMLTVVLISNQYLLCY